MKVIIFFLLLMPITVFGITAEELYGSDYAYHSHTAYGLRVAGR